jgi:hypothetical protein
MEISTDPNVHYLGNDVYNNSHAMKKQIQDILKNSFLNHEGKINAIYNHLDNLEVPPLHHKQISVGMVTIHKRDLIRNMEGTDVPLLQKGLVIYNGMHIFEVVIIEDFYEVTCTTSTSSREVLLSYRNGSIDTSLNVNKIYRFLSSIESVFNNSNKKP